MSEGAAPSGQSQAQQMSVVSGLMLLGLIVVAIGVFYFIGLKFIALPMEVFFAAFTLLWHWATVEAAEFSRLPNSVIGALVGVALAWQSTYLGGRYGMPNGLLMGLIPIVIALFLVIMNWVPIAFNSSAMLFVTILGAPALAKQGEFLQLAEAVIVGAVFFAAVVWAAKQYVDMRNKAKSGAVAA